MTRSPALAPEPTRLQPTAPVPPCARLADRRPVRVGLLGCGTVGSAVARRLRDDSGELAREARFELAAVAVRRPREPRAVDLAGLCPTDDPWLVAIDPSIDVVIEAMGGLEPARAVVTAALREGKSVVTANKQLIAAHGDELAALAASRGVHLRYDAAVGAATPILAFVHELASKGLDRIVGVLNGTTNFVLDAMSSSDLPPADALARAQELGYAEPDPRSDLEGEDAAAKAAIVAATAFGTRLDGTLPAREGISRISLADVRAARAVGLEIKLIATVERHDGHVDARVHPAALPLEHPLAGLRDRDNGVVCTIEGDARTLTGPGAGGDATAGAVLRDLVSIVRSLRGGRAAAAPRPGGPSLKSCAAGRPRGYLVRISDRSSTIRSALASESVDARLARVDETDVVVVTEPIDPTTRRRLMGRLACGETAAVSCLPLESEPVRAAFSG